MVEYEVSYLHCYYLGNSSPQRNMALSWPQVGFVNNYSEPVVDGGEVPV